MNFYAIYDCDDIRKSRPRQGVKSIAENSKSRFDRQRNLPDRSALFVVI